MKKGIISFAIAAGIALFAVGCADKTPASSVTCSGRVKTETRAVNLKYGGVKATDGIKVVISDRVKNIEVKCDKRVQDYVNLAVEKNVLNIEYGQIDIIGDPQTEVTVPASPELCYIYGVSGAHISTETPVSAEEVSIRATSGAVLDIQIDAQKCRVDINNEAVLTLSGKAGHCHVDAATGAVFNGKELDVRNFSSRTAGQAFINR